MGTKWTKWSEKELVNLPVWVSDGSAVWLVTCYTFNESKRYDDRGFVWTPVQLTKPESPREPSQAENDEGACVEFDTEAFESWILNDPCGREVKRREFHQAWMLASGLARKHERAEIAKMLPNSLPSGVTANDCWNGWRIAADTIRARCNGGAK